MNIFDFNSEYKKFAMSKFGITSMQFFYWEKLQESLYNKPIVSNSLTPYVLEEREMRVTQIDIFSRMMMDRILWVSGPVNDLMSTVLQAQLLFLDNLDDKKDIIMYVDGPGGSVKSGLSIIDTMEYIKSDISTVCTGMAASMDSVLLAAGTKGKRFSLPSSKVMLHQVSSGTEGTIQDMEISLAETRKINQKLFEKLGSYCGKDPEQIKKDADRDLWLTAEEAVAYGLIDGVVSKKI